jgi:NAD(P)-dependent dehydrogenase (short-subunit alcohol dehydrogenase family)
LAAANPAQIYFTGRNTKSADAVLKRVSDSGCKTPVQFIQCDLTDLASVKAAADKILAEQSRLDVFIANAGIMNQPPALTKDGYELQFGTNHLSHALLIKKLLPLMEQTAAQPGSDTRIVILTSTGLRTTPSGGIEFKELKTVQDAVLGGAKRYGQSKLANLLYARELAKRYPSITSVSVTPGIVGTDLVSSQGGVSKAVIWVAAKIGQGGITKPEDGTASQLWCAVGPKDKIVSGEFYEPIGKVCKFSTKYTKDQKLGGELWDWTQAELEKW